MDQSRRQFVLPPELKYSSGWRLNIIGEQLEPAQANDGRKAGIYNI
jgi:hypothetical protein